MSLRSAVAIDLYKIKWCEPGASCVSICTTSICAVFDKRNVEQMVRSWPEASGIGPIWSDMTLAAVAMSGCPLPPSPPLLLMVLLLQPNTRRARASERMATSQKLALDAEQLIHRPLVSVGERILFELVGRHPAKVLHPFRLERPGLVEGCLVQRERHFVPIIRVVLLAQLAPDHSFRAEPFAQLAAERRFVALARFDAPA